jgi:hypothetical protein
LTSGVAGVQNRGLIIRFLRSGDVAIVKVPTMGGVKTNLKHYGVGLLAGLGFNLITKVTGSGLVGGAIAAAVAGAVVPGASGEIIAVTLGFNGGRQGLGPLTGGLSSGGGILGRLTGALGGLTGGGGGAEQPALQMRVL